MKWAIQYCIKAYSNPENPKCYWYELGLTFTCKRKASKYLQDFMRQHPSFIEDYFWRLKSFQA